MKHCPLPQPVFQEANETFTKRVKMCIFNSNMRRLGTMLQRQKP